MGHENLEDRSQVKGSSNRSFGLVFATVFALIWGYLLFAGRGMQWWPLIVSGVFLALALIAPAVLTPLNVVWPKLGYCCTRSSARLCWVSCFFWW